MQGRIVAVAALVVAIAAAALVLTRGGDEYRLTLRFDNASQLVKGNEVKVGGLPVGTVEDIVLADDNAAEVKVRITDKDLTPLHEGTRAEIRVASLSSVATGSSSSSRAPTTRPRSPTAARSPPRARAPSSRSTASSRPSTPRPATPRRTSCATRPRSTRAPPPRPTAASSP
ncbi:MCE family protein [Conexibacter sp. W3-3-2]|nr:MCE family protein [Conexibacter sp. W3-3-2]